ncbi:hypothetical protein Bca4012_102667 [Brassica carinata]
MTVRQHAYQHAGPSRGLSGDFRHEDRLSVGDFRHEDCPRVIFATRTVRQHAYQHAGPSRGLSGDFRHDDYPPVCISARWPFPWTIRGRYSPRGLSVGDFRHEDCPPDAYQHAGPSRDCPVIFATRTVRQYAYQHAGPSRGLSGDFRHDDYPPVRISARWPFPWTIRGDIRHEDCPWVIFATRTVRQYAYQHAGPSRGLSAVIFATRTVRGLSAVIFATRTVRQDAYQHAGPSRGLSGDFRHEDCPPVRISARWPFPWTIRGDFRHAGLSAGDFRHEDCPRVIFATRTVRQHAYQHAGPSRGLSGDFRHEDCPPVRISARWPFPWTIRGDFRHEDCPWVIFATRTVRGDFRHEDCPPVRISARWPFPRTIRLSAKTHNSTLTLPVDCPVLFATRTVHQYTYRHAGPSRGLFGDFRHEDCPPRQPCTDGKSTWTVWVIFAHEDCPLVHISARWPFPRTVFGQLTHADSPSASERALTNGLSQRHAPLGAGSYRGSAIGGGRCAASSPDSDLEALSHNPAHGSFTPLAFQPSAMTNCANQRFLSHQVELLLRRWHQ